MDQVTTLSVQKAHELLKSGNKDEARKILMPIIQADRDVAEAWYLLAFTFTDPEKRMFSFQQVLRIDSGNPAAQKQVAKLLARSTVPAAKMSAAPVKKEQKKQILASLTWAMAGIVGLLFCVIFSGGWWLSRNGLAITLPTWTPKYHRPTVMPRTPYPTYTPTLVPSITPRPSLTHTPTPSQTLAPTLTFTLTPTQVIRANATSKATPNFEAFSVANSFETVDSEGPNWSSLDGNGSTNFSESKFGQLEAGESISIPLDIDSTDETTFNLQWVGEDTPVFTLTDPNDQQIDQDYVDKHPEEVSMGPAVFYITSTYKFKKVKAGTWQLNITASKAGGYRVFAIFKTNLMLVAGSDKHNYKVGDIATFIAYLYEVDNKTNKVAGFAGATVDLILVLSDGTTETISSKDYGTGAYATSYEIPDSKGYVSVNVTAKGNHNGKNYSRQSFIMLTIEPNDIQLTDEYSDNLGEIDGDKTLDVQVGIDTGHAGDFTVSAQLISGDQIIATRNEDVSLISGHNTITLKFQGEDIRHYRLDGPYKIKMLSILDQKSGVHITLRNNTWQTAAYRWRSFGDPICYSLFASVKTENAGSIEVNPAPNCPNGQYLSATVVTLKVTAKPGFQFAGWGGDMGGVNASSQVITLRMQRNMVANAFFEKQP